MGSKNGREKYKEIFLVQIDLSRMSLYYVISCAVLNASCVVNVFSDQSRVVTCTSIIDTIGSGLIPTT